MPLFISALIGGLIQAAGTLVGRVLMSLGFGYVSYSGISTSIDWAKTAAISHISGLGGTVVQLAGVLQVGTVISIVTSALTARMILNGLTGGALKKLVQK